MAWSSFRVSNAAKRSKRRRIHAMHPVHQNPTGQPWVKPGHDEGWGLSKQPSVSLRAPATEMDFGAADDLVEHDGHGGEHRDQAEQLGRVEILGEQGREIADAGGRDVEL